jgi:hypothetical protein
MNDKQAFATLYKDAYKKCFGHALSMLPSETESKYFGNTIFEETGLVIGAKSLKNYFGFVLNMPESKDENPSVATLDMLARYVLQATDTDETARKNKAGHYPYWY